MLLRLSHLKGIKLLWLADKSWVEQKSVLFGQRYKLLAIESPDFLHFGRGDSNKK